MKYRNMYILFLYTLHLVMFKRIISTINSYFDDQNKEHYRYLKEQARVRRDMVLIVGDKLQVHYQNNSEINSGVIRDVARIIVLAEDWITDDTIRYPLSEMVSPDFII